MNAEDQVRVITDVELKLFRNHLENEEKSENTIGKYIRDTRKFAVFTNGEHVTKELVLRYKESLISDYAPGSVNSMLIPLNRLFVFLGWDDLKIRTIKVQRRIYCPEDKELSKNEYDRLVRAAGITGNKRLELILKTIAGTGIRIGELKFITVEAARHGEASVRLKGKQRDVFIVKKLSRLLLEYAKTKKINTGPIFVTGSGKPVCRSNIWREMKSLCERSKVDPGKVFPHNLRHLFARVFYNIHRDIVKLADLLGHSSIDTTRIYTVSSGAEHRKIIETMRLVI